MPRWFQETELNPMVTKIILKKIELCSDEQKNAIRLLRNEEHVRKFMYTDHEISIKEHILWLKDLKKDPNRQVFLVLKNDRIVIGAVSLVDIDRNEKEAGWAFYLEQNAKGGLGPILEYTLIDYAFNQMNLETLKCEVLENNPNVLRLHRKFFFCVERFEKMRVYKNNKWLGAFFLSLSKKVWTEQSDLIYIKHKRIFEKFDINFTMHSASLNAN